MRNESNINSRRSTWNQQSNSSIDFQACLGMDFASCWISNMLICTKPWKATAPPKSDSHDNSNYSDVKDFDGNSYGYWYTTVSIYGYGMDFWRGYSGNIFGCRKWVAPKFQWITINFALKLFKWPWIGLATPMSEQNPYIYIDCTYIYNYIYTVNWYRIYNDGPVSNNSLFRRPPPGCEFQFIAGWTRGLSRNISFILGWFKRSVIQDSLWELGILMYFDHLFPSRYAHHHVLCGSVHDSELYYNHCLRIVWIIRIFGCHTKN